MASLDSLKQALRDEAKTATLLPMIPLCDAQYDAGFSMLQDLEWKTYEDFIIPQLAELVTSVLDRCNRISVLEIGPGPKTILGYLPSHLKRKIKKYTAFEPNGCFAARLSAWLETTTGSESPLPCLDSPCNIHQKPFALEDKTTYNADVQFTDSNEYDLVLFCHSMYGMKFKNKIIERALSFLDKEGLLIVFHRSSLHLNGLVCNQTASFPTGMIYVVDHDEVLDRFASFIAGVVTSSDDRGRAIQSGWRSVCRALGHRDGTHPGHLIFRSPNIMLAFTKHATALSELRESAALLEVEKRVKNFEARLRYPAAVYRPTEVRLVQKCIRWALEHGVRLTVVGGGHSGHCLWSNVVAVDMGAFDQIHILQAGEEEAATSESALVVVETGCKVGDVIAKTMEAGLTVPLGARPSVGAGLCLQGGIGHLARLQGLACDAIMGAVVVSVSSGKILYVGCVPSQHRPEGAIRAENEAELMWALRGAGNNCGIVISVTFRACPAPTYSVRNWNLSLRDETEARHKLSEFDKILAKELPRSCSADAYLYWREGQLHMGVTVVEASTMGQRTENAACGAARALWGPETEPQLVDGVGLFETEMYMSGGMNGAHGSGKTSSFKRCLFLRDIRETNVVKRLIAAMENRPSPLCYFHLLHGGGAIGDMEPGATAFGCRDWEFACVITGVWRRKQDGQAVADEVVQWVYHVAEGLLPYSSGAYGADLGPDPRDAGLAAEAFGPNRARLARVKRDLDPCNVLAYACPLPRGRVEPKLIVLVTGESGAGKDYCAQAWVTQFRAAHDKKLAVRAVSISDATKREYAAAAGADVHRLLNDRAYKEEHRPALTAFFKSQLKQRPQLLEEHFLHVVSSAPVHVLLITGMREAAPVAALSHLVPESRLLEVRVQARPQVRRNRREGYGDGDGEGDGDGDGKDDKDHPDGSHLIFDNDSMGRDAASDFAKRHLLPFLHPDLQRLANMVRSVPDFPRTRTGGAAPFRHVLGISQQSGGLALCTSLLHSHFTGDWATIDAVVCCEVGGLVYAPALALRIGVPLVLIREAGKLPGPTVSAMKPSSYISSLASLSLGAGGSAKRIEMEHHTIPQDASVVVVDDVLSTGQTLCAMLQLLREAGVDLSRVHVMVVAEFPIHRGRHLLHQRGFGKVNIQSLLVFGGK